MGGYLKTTATAVVAAVLVVAMALTTAEAQNTQDCISKLAVCADSVNATKPTETCCSSIKEAVTTELPCLCNVYTTPGLLAAFHVSLDQALNLTKACDVPVDISKCNSTLSPQPQPPSAVPGSGNGAEMIAWTGVSALCIFFVSMLFY